MSRLRSIQIKKSVYANFDFALASTQTPWLSQCQGHSAATLSCSGAWLELDSTCSSATASDQSTQSSIAITSWSVSKSLPEFSSESANYAQHFNSNQRSNLATFEQSSERLLPQKSSNLGTRYSKKRRVWSERRKPRLSAQSTLLFI